MYRLLAAGAVVDQTADLNTHNGFTALHLAAGHGNVEMVKLILAHGASIESRTASETTPFYRAIRGGRTEVVDILHDAGSEINAKTWDSFTHSLRLLVLET